MGPDLHCTDLVLPRGLVTSCVRDIRHVCHNDSVSPSSASKVMMSPLNLSFCKFLPFCASSSPDYSYCDAPDIFLSKGFVILEFGAIIKAWISTDHAKDE